MSSEQIENGWTCARRLVGWLEGLFHGIQASLWSQQVAAQAQLAEVRQKKALEGRSDDKTYPGVYL